MIERGMDEKRPATRKMLQGCGKTMFGRDYRSIQPVDSIWGEPSRSTWAIPSEERQNQPAFALQAYPDNTPVVLLILGQNLSPNCPAKSKSASKLIQPIFGDVAILDSGIRGSGCMVTDYSPSLIFRRRRAFVITERELVVMAALAMIGLKRIPNQGYRIPAATGMARVL